MKILDTIAAALKGKTAPPAAKLAELLTQTRAETEGARAKLAELEGQRADKAIADEAERRQYRADLNAARDDVADGEAAIDGLQGRHATAVAAEADAGRRKAYKAAGAKAGELSSLVDDYAKAAQAVRDTVSKIAEIDAVVVAANKDLPAGVAPLQDSGTLRSTPAAAKQVVSEKTVDLWCLEGRREPIALEYQHTVVKEANGQGYTHPQNARNPMRHELRKFIRREFLPATAAVSSVPLDRIKLPDTFAGKLERSVQIEHELVAERTVA